MGSRPIYSGKSAAKKKRKKQLTNLCCLESLLPAIVHSPISADNGLAMSFLERLIARSVYAKDLDAHENTYGYDPRVLTKLVNNYRAHPALLAIPNELFYNNELVAAAEQW